MEGIDQRCWDHARIKIGSVLIGFFYTELKFAVFNFADMRPVFGRIA